MQWLLCFEEQRSGSSKGSLTNESTISYGTQNKVDEESRTEAKCERQRKVVRDRKDKTARQEGVQWWKAIAFNQHYLPTFNA
jgi:hypothetical protein